MSDIVLLIKLCIMLSFIRLNVGASICATSCIRVEVCDFCTCARNLKRVEAYINLHACWIGGASAGVGAGRGARGCASSGGSRGGGC